MEDSVNTTNSILLASLFTVIGQWTRKKPLTVKIGVGALFAAVGLAAIGNIDQKLANDFAMLILVASILYNGPVVFAAISKATS